MNLYSCCYLKSNKYKHWVLDYYLVNKEQKWFAILKNKRQTRDIVFFKNECMHKSEQEMLNWFKNCVDNNIVNILQKQGYEIEYQHETVMWDIRETNLAYCISPKSNHNKIMNEGLEVQYNESGYKMDECKPSYIPKWVSKENSTKLLPYIDNFLITERKYIEDSYLYVVEIGDKNGWIGSQALSGFFDIKNLFNYNQNKEKEIAIKYWENSCSLNDYLEGAKYVEEINTEYRLDEILLFDFIHKDDIIPIGHWDTLGYFKTNELFKNYIRTIYLEDYQDILSNY